MKAYQYSSHNSQEAYNKLCRSKEKLDAAKQSARGSSRRKDHLESKELEVLYSDVTIVSNDWGLVSSL